VQVLTTHAEQAPFANYLAAYQPKLALASGLVSGYEALARTRDKDGALQSAGALFFNNSINKGYKLALDRYLREQAIEYFAAHPEAGQLALNISPCWVDRLDVDHISPTIAMVEQSGIDPSRIIIEITESSGTLQNLSRLTAQYHRAGLQVAIDDFGVGASQVDRVIALQPDYIKLDMGLFKAAAQGGASADVALATTALAQRAGCKIVCEGVENAAEFHFAVECGADIIQGWLFAAAAEDLVAGDSFASQIVALKRSYLERKSQQLRDSALHNQRVAGAVMALCEQLRDGDSIASILNQAQLKSWSEMGLLRCYICDENGTQVSDNYNLSASSDLLTCANYRGYNWSHRPYFPLLKAMQSVQVERVVVSNPYKDIGTGSLCKTYGKFISGRRILLVDVIVNDDVLFVLP
jgi:EAL domain-containing protein (putative c-di-GMP-specific phosphodiesterase class I)